MPRNSDDFGLGAFADLLEALVTCLVAMACMVGLAVAAVLDAALGD